MPRDNGKGKHHRVAGNHYGRPLTTGQVARLCRVAPDTVRKWMDSGRLSGYRVPGSRDRRIPVREFHRFAREHGIDVSTGAVVLVGFASDHARRIRHRVRDEFVVEVIEASDPFEAGMAIGGMASVLVLDTAMGWGEARQIVVRANEAGITVVAFGAFSIADTDAVHWLGQRPNDDALVAEIARVIDPCRVPLGCGKQPSASGV